jgi:hypothetical protein
MSKGSLIGCTLGIHRWYWEYENSDSCLQKQVCLHCGEKGRERSFHAGPGYCRRCAVTLRLSPDESVDLSVSGKAEEVELVTRLLAAELKASITTT